MVLIGNIQVPIYIIDTEQDIRRRIAAAMDTIPKYLYIETPINDLYSMDQNQPIQVTDYLDNIKSGADYKRYFPIVVKQLPQLNFERDILYPYIAYNMEKNNPLAFSNEMELNNTLENMGKIPVNDFNQIYMLQNNIKSGLDLDIQENKKTSQQNDVLIGQYENINVTGIDYTDIVVTKITYRYDLYNTENMDIIDFFNRAILSKTVPFATYNQYYKILKKFILPQGQDWLEDINPELLQMKVATTPDNYIDTWLHKSDSIISLYLNFLDTIQPVDNVINFLTQNTLQYTDISEIHQERMSGRFFILDNRLNKYVFADMAMNDPIMSKFIMVDEIDKTTKEKNELAFKFSYKGVLISANMSERIKTETEYRYTSEEVKIPMYQPYIRVNIFKAPTVEDARIFQSMFIRLFVYYKNKYDSVVKEYEKYIPDFLAMSMPQIQQKYIKPADIQQPQDFKKVMKPYGIFKKGETDYGCNNKVKVVNADYVQNMEQGEYLLYPREDNILGIPQQYIVCDHHKTHKYPGLKDNPFSNKESLPYLPCCYKINQWRYDTNTYNYYNKDVIIADDKQTYGTRQGIIKTNKFVSYGTLGEIPKSIEKIFIPHTMHRIGISERTPSSFLECVMEAVNADDIQNIKPGNERRLLVHQHRQRMVNIAKATGICRQELYNETPQQIAEQIQNLETYLDPRMFVRLLEYVYDCVIYIFQRKEDTETKLVLPRFIQNYLYHEPTDKAKRRIVFIYEHAGTRDTETYPQCELIIKKNQYIFQWQDDMVKTVTNIFNQLKNSYRLNIPVENTILPLTNIQSQVIDYYGKTRIITINMGQDILYLQIPNGIAPLPIKEINYENELYITKYNYSTVKEFIIKSRAKIKGQYVNQNMTTGVVLEIGNVDVVMNLVDIPVIQGIDVLKQITRRDITIPSMDKSFLNKYNIFRRISRYMVQYFYWMYSKYIHEENKLPGQDNIQDFINKYVTIQPAFKYNVPDKKFSMYSTLCMDNKLVVTNKEILRRLISMLLMKISRQPSDIQSFHKEIYINDYYMDITDFTYHPHQIIFHGINMVNDYFISQNAQTHNLHKSILTPTPTNPYFFTYDNTMFIAQKTHDFKSAAMTSETWNNQKYNDKGQNKDEEFNKDVVLYSYKSSCDITPYIVKSSSESTIYEDQPYVYPEVLGYREECDNPPTFLSLLEL